MTRRNGIVFFIILVIFAVTVWAIVPNSSLSGAIGREGMRLGLDLVGGVHLVYQAQFSEEATDADKKAAMERVQLVIEKRIDAFGVTEPVIQTLGNDRILIQLPGFTDTDAARNLVEQTGFLDFREVEKDDTGELVYLSDYLEDDVTDFYNTSEKEPRLFVNNLGEGEEYGRFIATLSEVNGVLTFTDINGDVIDSAILQQYKGVVSWIIARGDDGITPLTGNLLEDAQPALGGTLGTEPEVAIEWTSEGSIIFDQIAARLHDPLGENGPYSLDYVLGIFLDNTLISAPKINMAAYGGSGVISGSFTRKSAEELANLLKSGALPVQLHKPPLYQEKVSATLGAEFIDMSWKAGLVAILLVMLFMILYYRLPGFMASLALVFYGTLTLTICKLWPITLSLGGIGGIIVSMGIAVDANVLIFERMKEEFRAGRTLGAAIEAGFHRAWTAIWDSNVTTFIACIILYWLGSSAMHNAAVTGFAITLFIGAVVSMFTAVTVTRTLLRLFPGTALAQQSWLFTVTGGRK
jgi:protein-export membrane protein SecD